MDIIIIADFCGRFDDKINSRFLYLANKLCKNHDVEIVTSDFDHGSKSYFSISADNYPYKITMLHEGKYKKNVSISRFVAHYVWGTNVAKYLAKRKKPDVIYCAVPTLKAANAAAKYAEANHIRFIVDIQDLWPEAFKMIFHVPVISNAIFFPFRYLADGIYKRADEIIAVSNRYVERGLKVNKKCKTGHAVFLGTELTDFDNNISSGTKSERIKEILAKKKSDDCWIAYCGTLGYSYDLTCVIDALKIIQDRDNLRPKFIVMGKGIRKEEFEKYAEANKVDAIFTDILPYADMCVLLHSCDITINPIIKGAAASIINKHADYAASGLPVLNTQECEEYRELVETYNMGMNCENGSAKDVADKLRILLCDKQKRLDMGKNARRCAEEKFDRRQSYESILQLITMKEC